MTCKKILPGCFDGADHFASDLLSRINAAEYLKCHLEELDAWLGVEQEIGNYLRSKNVPEAQIAMEIEKASSLIEPWLP
jgi:hypothetical protein